MQKDWLFKAKYMYLHLPCMDFNINITKAFTLKMSFCGGIGQMVAKIIFFYGMFSNNNRGLSVTLS